MNLKIVYGPPPAGGERIESLSLEQEDEIRETDIVKSAQSDIGRCIKALYDGKLRHPIDDQ